MAKEEKIPEPFIDYSGETGIDWTGKDLTNYWSKELTRVHRIGGRVWTVKERTMATRLVKEFTRVELEAMVDHWMAYPPENGSVASFVSFYSRRQQICQALKPKDYDWD